MATLSLNPASITVLPPAAVAEPVVTAKQESEKSYCEHLFLSESKKFFCIFLNALRKRTPDAQIKREINSIKHRCLTILKKDIYGPKARELLWSRGAVEKSKAHAEWSTQEEEDRQKRTMKLFKEAMYEVLLLFPDADKVHREVCLQIAEKRKAEITDTKGKIAITSKFSLFNPETPEAIKGVIETRQYGKKILSSLEKRKEPIPVNLHKERVTFTTPEGRSISSVQLRSGSFDFPDIKIEENPLDSDSFILNPVDKELLDKDMTRFIKKFADRTQVHTLRKLVLSLIVYKKNLNGAKAQQCQKHIDHFALRLAKMEKDQQIIRANSECITGLFHKVHHDLEKGKKLGMELPEAVRDVFAQDEVLGKENWGMISLQTPVNIVGGEGWLNRTILHFAKSSSIPWIRKICRMLADKDLSELDPIYREMRGYKEAAKKTSGFVKEALYFNLPTNFFGTRFRFGLGLFKWYARLNKRFVIGKVDTLRLDKINNETSHSIKRVHALSMRAVRLLSEAIAKETDEGKRATLLRHRTSITSLSGQIFEIHKGNISLRIAPKWKAQYEVLGRLTILMQLLNFNTTGHCRSGNNRTAAWLAKSHQVACALAASSTGGIDSIATMAGKLAQRETDHWSLETYFECYKNSLTLQQANKGTRGTKLKIYEVKNKTLQRTLFRGAFDLAGRYEEEELRKAAHRKQAVKAAS